MVLSWVFAFAAFHHTHLHPFQFSDFTVGAKIHGLTVPQVINWKRILYGVRTDNLFPRMAPKTLRICRRLGDNGGGAPVKKRSYPASAYLSLPRSSFFGLFLAMSPALVAIPVSFTVGGIFHAVGKPAAALPHCSITERQFRVWVAALCRWQAHAHQNASLVPRKGC